MRRRWSLIACLALMASSGRAAKADPIMGTVTLTVAQDPGVGLWGSAINQGPAVYSSGQVDLSQFFQVPVVTFPDGSYTEIFPSVTLSGPLLIRWDNLGSFLFNTTFDLKIAFDGASGNGPTIDATGTLNGFADSNTSDVETGPSNVLVGADATFQSATVQGWTPGSGVPMSLIDQFLKASNLRLGDEDVYTVNSTGGFPTSSTFSFSPDPSAVTYTPEPATLLIYLSAIAGLGVRGGARLRRSPPAR